MTLRRPIPLLPYEKALAAELGVSEAAYQQFKAEVAARTRIDPAAPVAGGPELYFVLNLVIGIGFTALGALFKPKAPGKPPTIDPRQVSGATRSENQRRAPRYGFNAVQDVATAGQRYPLVIARREQRPDGRTYGGVRVNLLLLWSQMWSLNGNQLFRGIYLLGRKCMHPAIDPKGFAFGDNSLVAYDYGTASNRSARYSLYGSANGGRLTTNDWIGGQNPFYDKANAQNFGGQDVFCYRGNDFTIQNGFCTTAKPSSGTTLGLYGVIPNGMAYRVAPRLRPTCSCQIYTRNSGQDFYVECEDDTAALADFWKSKYCWSSRSGLRSYKRGGRTTTPATGSAFQLVQVRVDDLLSYFASNTTDAETKIKMYSGNTDADDDDSQTIADCAEIGSSVAGWQHDADDSMTIGELYKIGSALAVLESQNPNSAFVSDADNEPIGGGRSIEYRFRVVRAGVAGFVGSEIINPSTTGDTITPPYYNRDDDIADQDGGERYQSATSFPQIMRCAVGGFGVTRPTRLIEVGFRHAIALRINGFTNFRDCPKLREVNAKAGQNRTGGVSSGAKLNPSIFQSGTVVKNETRFAFYQLWWRDGFDSGWTVFSDGIFGFRSSTGEAAYEYLRIEFPSISTDWQVRFEPLSGWQVRTGAGWGGDMIVLDSGSPIGSRTDESSGFRIVFNGYEISQADAKRTFGLQTIDAKFDIGYGYTEGESMIDAYGRLAEKFVYDELTATTTGGPEVEISYVNIFTENQERADYNDLALIGINVMAGAELGELSQASQDVAQGYMMRRCLEADSYGPSHVFPDILRELMTSPWLGDGAFITDAQIDLPSFQAAAQWCYDRYYFYDGVITDPVNLLSWTADVGATNLLQLVKRGSKFALKPALVFNTPVPIVGLFTAGNIVEQSFEMTLIPFEDRQPISAIGKYREQSPSISSYRAGLFPRDRTVSIREQGRPDTDPAEDFDLSDYCTSERQLIDAMCFIIRRRRLVDHTISFRTTPEGLTASLAAGDYIQVAYDLIYFDQYAHGIISNNGVLSTTRPDLMPPGTHPCLTWDGSENPPIEQDVVVAADGTATPAGVFFARKDTSQELRTYEITRIAIDRAGEVSIEASHHPCDASGYSLLAADWTTYETDAHWEIRR